LHRAEPSVAGTDVGIGNAIVEVIARAGDADIALSAGSPAVATAGLSAR
jgi:hypothetical protein